MCVASVHTFSVAWVIAPVVPGISFFLVCVESKVCVTVFKWQVCVRYTQYTYGVVHLPKLSIKPVFLHTQILGIYVLVAHTNFVHVSGICTQSNTG